MSQHQKIYEFAKDLDWHCQTEFWAVSHSPHKRRAEMSQNPKYIRDYKASHDIFGIWEFEDRPCNHGIDGARDYRIVVSKNTRSEPETYHSPPKIIKRNPNPFQVSETVAMINNLPRFREEKAEIQSNSLFG